MTGQTRGEPLRAEGSIANLDHACLRGVGRACAFYVTGFSASINLSFRLLMADPLALLPRMTSELKGTC